MHVVERVEILLGKRAALLQDVVDRLVEQRVVAGGVGIPDFVNTRVGRMAVRADSLEG